MRSVCVCVSGCASIDVATRGMHESERMGQYVISVFVPSLQSQPSHVGFKPHFCTEDQRIKECLLKLSVPKNHYFIVRTQDRTWIFVIVFRRGESSDVSFQQAAYRTCRKGPKRLVLFEDCMWRRLLHLLVWSCVLKSSGIQNS